MSNELAIAEERGQSMAELMGVRTSTGDATPSTARIGMLHSPLMGEVEFKGKTIKTEVVPVGAFIMTQGETKVYSNGVTVRIFAQRQQWQRWNSESTEMEKSVLANTLNGDLMDSIGGFNLGRPSGYIENFNELDQATKDIMRSVKRVKVFYGTVTLDNPIDAAGEPVEGDFTDIPFVMDIKNRDSLKSIDAVLNTLQRSNKLPIMSTIKLVGVEDVIPTGAKFGKIEASMGEDVALTEEDNTTLRNFLELVEWSNGKIIDLHNERSDKGMSEEDNTLVNDILNNDFVDVE